MNVTKRVLVGAALLAMGTMVVPVEATIISTGGAVTKIVPPLSLVEGNPATSSDSQIFAVDEQELILLSDLTINVAPAPGDVINGPIAVAPTTTISAGTAVQSHIIHSDRINPGNSTGSVSFSNVILGLIFAVPELDATDALLGNGVTTYPTGTSFRGMISPGGEIIDHITVSTDLKSLTTITQASSGEFLDQIRVITAVPEPTTILLMALGLVGLGTARRRRKI